VCDNRGYEVVGIAENLDVSAGKTSASDRPQLGDWLENRRGEFDVIGPPGGATHQHLRVAPKARGVSARTIELNRATGIEDAITGCGQRQLRVRPL
jgi:hypothetical protein